MIRKSFLAGGALLLLYGLAFPHLPRRHHGVYGQHRNNYLRAQQYLHEAKEVQSIIVGSSISNALSDSILGRDCFKLTFPGGSVFTGLEALVRSGRTPPFVLIESNALLRDADHELLDDLFSPWRRSLRSISTVFREEGRPSNFGIAFVYTALNRTSMLFTSEDAPGAKGAGFGEASVPEQVMQATRRQLGSPPAPDILTRRIDRMAECVATLEKRGSVCVFFEMPIDSSLTNLAEPDAIRRAMARRFPDTRYARISIDRTRSYATVDGIHLTQVDANYVSEEISGRLDALIQSHEQKRARPKPAGQDFVQSSPPAAPQETGDGNWERKQPDL